LLIHFLEVVYPRGCGVIVTILKETNTLDSRNSAVQLARRGDAVLSRWLDFFKKLIGLIKSVPDTATISGLSFSAYDRSISDTLDIRVFKNTISETILKLRKSNAFNVESFQKDFNAMFSSYGIVWNFRVCFNLVSRSFVTDGQIDLAYNYLVDHDLISGEDAAFAEDSFAESIKSGYSTRLAIVLKFFRSKYSLEMVGPSVPA
jgi:hypothetical protein